MKFSDILALAKSGYSVADVKELMALEHEPEEEPKEEPKEEPEEEHKEEPKEEPDYKKLYEETKVQLENAQKANTHQNNKGSEKTDDEIFIEFAKTFM